MVLGTASLALLYLTAASIFLNSELGPWVVNGGWRDQPRRVQLRWDSGTSLWPGRFEVRGLELHGRNRRVVWSATLERGRGTLDLAQLLLRQVRITHISGDGVRVMIDRQPEGAEAPLPPPPRKRRWTVDLPEISLANVREISIGASRLAGEGTASGGFRSAAGEVSVEEGKLEMKAARLESRGRAVATDIALAVEASLAPYVPREHPGALGLDFLSGTLVTSGRLSAEAAPGASGEALTGTFEADLRAEDGRLQPPTRLAWSSRSAYPLTIDASVVELAGQALLKIGIDAQGFQVGPRDGEPPLLVTRTLHVTTASAETRLSRIFGKAREAKAPQGGEESGFVAGEFLAEDLRLDLRGRRMSCRLAMDRATGRLDLGAFLHRDLVVEGMRGDGVSARLEVADETAEPPPAARRPWALHFTDTRLAGFRDISLDGLSLAGAAEAEASFSLEPGGSMAVERVALNLPKGVLTDADTVVAHEVAFQVEGKAEPFDFGQSSFAEALAAVSGTTEMRAQVSGLGFLRHYFERARWLGLQGHGRLAANLTVDHGRLAPGSRLEVAQGVIEAQILGAVARGRGRIVAAVNDGAGGPRLNLDARLDRFAVEDGPRARYLEGGGLVVKVASAEAVQLGAQPADLSAVVDLPEASLPDLSAYNALLPPGADVNLLPGSGRVRLHLELDGASHTGKGQLTFSSESAHLRVQELVVGGRLRLEAPLVSPALLERRFELDGARLTLEPATYHEMGDAAEEPVHPWWARAEMPDASLTMGRPITFDGSLEVEMKDSGPFLALFAQRRRFLRWFTDVLLVEGVSAQARVKLDGTAVTVDPLEVSSDKITLASRMRFSAGAKEGDLFVTYGNLAVGIELRDGKRDFKLLKAREWFESWWKGR